MEKVKNVLIAAAGIAVVILLAWLAWKLAGLVIRIVLSVAIFCVLAGLVWYFVRRLRGR